MTRLALNQSGEPVTAGSVTAKKRGRYQCAYCGATLIERGASCDSPADAKRPTRRTAHFLHVSKPDCHQEKLVAAFLNASSSYSSANGDVMKLMPGLKALRDGTVLYFSSKLGIFLKKLDKPKE